ncbi:flagellar hook-basal body complex protein [Baekduia soli]|uniref:Flagellar hook protein FlgE n=1 Tax=Baekduia soli TaxID=496014 RepID=A0A5B8U1Z2_9ACTN|nr:flagellar hook-basal body complex protein [Baekduia soli]QEC46845.1 flagellar hook-basal body complex protein [Baekduia soli]
MIRGMYSAISGLRTHQTMLDVTANNLANVNTVGYKASRTTFKDQLQQTLAGGSASNGANTGGTNAAQVGLGVQLGSVDPVMGEGSLQSTGNSLDVAIQGDGWFQVGLGDPAPAGGGTPAAPTDMNYTRAGNFIRNDQGYLTTSEGYYVLADPTTTPTNPITSNPAGPYIVIPDGATNVSVGSDGSVSYLPGGGGTRVSAGKIQLAKFPNDSGLLRQSGNRWSADPAAGTPDVGTPNGTTFGATIGGTLEMSNVDLASEFTNMIVAQRGFQANSRVISTADEMLQDLVNLKR